MTWKDNHIRYKSCERKKRYKTYNEAMKDAKRFEKRTGIRLYPYECRFCNGWHLSHKYWED